MLGPQILYASHIYVPGFLPKKIILFSLRVKEIHLANSTVQQLPNL